MELSENLKRLRKEKGMSQLQLAIGSGVSQSLICKYELGIYSPRLTTAARLADALEVSIDELLGAGFTDDDADGIHPNAYQKRVVIVAINHRINDEIKRLSEGMNMTPSLVRKIWEGSFQNESSN